MSYTTAGTMASCAARVSFADPQATTFYAGLTVSGGELPYNTTPGFPSDSELDYFVSLGVTQLRVMFSWQLAQNSLNGELNPVYIAGMTSLLARAHAKGVRIIYAVAEYARIEGDLCTPRVPLSALMDFWRRMGRVFWNSPALAGYELIQPSASFHPDEWCGYLTDVVRELRRSDSNTLVYVSGVDLSLPPSWHILPHNTNPLPFDTITAAFHVEDPANRIVYALQRLTSAQTNPLIIQQFVRWLHAYHKVGVAHLSVSGTPTTCTTEEINAALSKAELCESLNMPVFFGVYATRESEANINAFPFDYSVLRVPVGDPPQFLDAPATALLRRFTGVRGTSLVLRASTDPKPFIGVPDVASPTFTITYPGYLSNAVRVAPSDGGMGGTFTPNYALFSSNTLNASATFTYTPRGAITATISATSSDASITRINALGFSSRPSFLEGLNSELCNVYALHRAITSYTGACIRLLRVSDGVEKDFGFPVYGSIQPTSSPNTDWLTLNLIAEWAASSPLRVVCWYDQSAAQNHLQYDYLQDGADSDEDTRYSAPIFRLPDNVDPFPRIVFDGRAALSAPSSIYYRGAVTLHTNAIDRSGSALVTCSNGDLFSLLDCGLTMHSDARAPYAHGLNSNAFNTYAAVFKAKSNVTLATDGRVKTRLPVPVATSFQRHHVNSLDADLGSQVALYVGGRPEDTICRWNGELRDVYVLPVALSDVQLAAVHAYDAAQYAASNAPVMTPITDDPFFEYPAPSTGLPLYTAPQQGTFSNGIAIYTGANNASTEAALYGSMPGEDYNYPAPNTLTGSGPLRIAFLPERLQPEPNGPLNHLELDRLRDLVEFQYAHGKEIVLQALDNATFHGEPVGLTGTNTSVDEYANLFIRLGRAFRHWPNVVLSVARVPQVHTTVEWVAILKRLNELIPPQLQQPNHVRYAVPFPVGALSEFAAATATFNPATPVTASSSFVWCFELEWFLDADHNGTSNVCVATPPVSFLEPYTQWMRARGVRGYLTSSWSGDSTCTAPATALQTYLNANADVWISLTRGCVNSGVLSYPF